MLKPNAYSLMVRTLFLSTAFLFYSGVHASAPAVADSVSEWNFKVYLNNSEIGYHNFKLMEADGESRLETEADFKVRFLFITAYEYSHVNSETWAGDCLQRIDARTDANGKVTVLSGEKEPDGFEVTVTNQNNMLSGCIMSFAYWNRDFLDAGKLLNAQTGEYLPVQTEATGQEILVVRGQEMTAQRYRLVAKGVELDVWYAEDGRWLGLQSTLKNGRKLRYELV